MRRVARWRRTRDGLLNARVGDDRVVVAETYGAVRTTWDVCSESEAVGLFESIAGPNTAAAGWECTEVIVEAFCSLLHRYDLAKLAEELGVAKRRRTLVVGSTEISERRVVFRGARDVSAYTEQLDRLGPVLQRCMCLRQQ